MTRRLGGWRTSPANAAGSGTASAEAKEETISSNRGRPIFIIGCGRSGTTMLGLMLQAHPRIAIPPENRFLLPTYFERSEYGDLSKPENRRLVADKIIKTKGGQFKDLGLDAHEITEQIVARCSTVGSALGLVLRAYADRFGKPRWGDKRPGYHSYIWVIQRLFPDAQFVHIVRDGRDAVASMKFGPQWDRSITTYRRAVAWAEAIDHTKKARKQLRPDSFYELQYEKLVANPEEQLRPLCDFLGEPFHAAMLNPQEVSHQVVPERKSWHANTRHVVSTSSVGKFAERLEPWELQLCEAVFGDQLEEYGYQLTEAPAPAKEHLDEYRRTAAARRNRLRQERRQDLSVWDAQPVADMPPTQDDRQEERMRELERRVACLSRERDKLQARLDRVTGSRSWRWTQPVRTVLGGTARRRP